MSLLFWLFTAADLIFTFGTETWVPEENLGLPEPQYLRHPPTYIPPTPDAALPREMGDLEKRGHADSEALTAKEKNKTSDQLREKFLALVQRAVPTAVVDIIPSGATVILMGNVSSADDIPILMEVARALFPGATIINGMRIGAPQTVELEVIVARVNRTKMRQRGLDLQNNGSPNLIAQIINDKKGFVENLHSLQKENMAKILAESHVVTLSGRPATIIDGGQVPYVAPSSQGAKVEYLPFGTFVHFLPIVLGNGKIHLEVYPQISDVITDLSLTVGGTNPVSAPAFNTRSVRAAVQMEDGKTLVIGGLIQNRTNATETRVPFLGDLPVIGNAFRSVSFEKKEEELLFLVTPQLLDPMASGPQLDVTPFSSPAAKGGTAPEPNRENQPATLAHQTPKVQKELADQLDSLRKVRAKQPREYVLEMKLMEAGDAGEPKVSAFPKVTVYQDRWFTVFLGKAVAVKEGNIHDLLGFTPLPAAVVKEEGKKEPPPDEVQVGFLVRGKVAPHDARRLRLDLELRKNDLDAASRDDLVVTGTYLRTAQRITPGQVNRHVLQEDEEGQPAVWLEIVVREGGEE